MAPLLYFQLLGAALFGIGLYGVLARRSAVLIVLSIELMLICFVFVSDFQHLQPGAACAQDGLIVNIGPLDRTWTGQMSEKNNKSLESLEFLEFRRNLGCIPISKWDVLRTYVHMY